MRRNVLSGTTNEASVGERTMKKRGTLALFVLVSLCALVWFVAANPLNLFVRRSDRFSMEKFRSIKPGMRFDDAISLLGKPIIVRKSGGLICKDCTAYHFLGDPPSWLLSYQEAWLLVNSRGQVVTTTVNSEP